MTKQQEALRLADVLIGSPQFSGTPIWQAADMLRRQHEAIVKLREALKNYVESDETAREYGVGVGGDAMDIAEQALKDTEGLA